MKIILTILVLYIFVYIFFVVLAITKYSFLTYSDIDLDKSGLLSLSEISYIINSKIRYKCYLNNKDYVYCNKFPDKSKYIKIDLEVYSLKDGLPIKETTVFSENAQEQQ